MGLTCFEARLFKTAKHVLYSLVLFVCVTAAGVPVWIVDDVVLGTMGAVTRPYFLLELWRRERRTVSLNILSFLTPCAPAV